MREFVVEFYQILPPKGVTSMEIAQSLDAARRRSVKDRDVETRKGTRVRIQKDGGFEDEGRVFFCDLARVRESNDMSFKVPIDAEATQFEHSPSDGAGDMTAFCFEPNNNLLAVQVNHFGPGIGTWCSLARRVLEETKTDPGRIEYSPIAPGTFEELLASMRSVNKVRVSFLLPDQYRATDPSATAAMNAVRSLVQSDEFQLVIKARPDTVWSSALSKIRDLAGSEKESIQELAVDGADDHGLPIHAALKKRQLQFRTDWNSKSDSTNDWLPRRYRMLQAMMFLMKHAARIAKKT